MKKLIITTALLISFSISATSLHPNTNSFSASLNGVMNIDQNSELNELNISSGIVQISTGNKEITLKLNYFPKCKAEIYCIEMIQVLEIILPLKKSVTDFCNNTTYIASLDKRSIAGVLKELVITDYTQNQCPTFVPLPDTGIILKLSFYNKLEGLEVKSHSTFEADQLK
ncbi:MAG: hypothetical protein HN576_07520 [Bacteriovoracaceae bacterium]|jgi:hypothetical protein|nr:hypothetical protein [Bacteriovoracaceae bacterium]